MSTLIIFILCILVILLAYKYSLDMRTTTIDLKSKEVKYSWEPDDDQVYYTVDVGYVSKHIKGEIGDFGYKYTRERGYNNSFETKAQAEEALERVKQTLNDYRAEILSQKEQVRENETTN